MMVVIFFFYHVHEPPLTRSRKKGALKFDYVLLFLLPLFVSVLTLVSTFEFWFVFVFVCFVCTTAYFVYFPLLKRPTVIAIISEFLIN